MSEQGLAARLQILEDKQAIAETLYGYAHHIDHKDIARWLDLFTAPFVYQAKLEGENGAGEDYINLEGEEALRGFVTNFQAPGTKTQSNIISQPLITLDGDRADSMVYFAIVRDIDGAREIRSYGRYIDKLERCADGKWRIARRLCLISNLAEKRQG